VVHRGRADPHGLGVQVKRLHYKRPADCACGAHHVSYPRSRIHRQTCPAWHALTSLVSLIAAEFDCE
jgi:hypothetical protein